MPAWRQYEEITDYKVFILLERIGNIKKKVLTRRIDQLLSNAVEANLLDKNECKNIIGYYQKFVDNGHLFIDDKDSFQRLIKKWT